MPTLDLQSGFIVAVILAALFLADRLPQGALVQRALQAAIALALLLTVAAGTEAVVPSPNAEDLSAEVSEELQEIQEFGALPEAPEDQFFGITEDLANDDDVRAMIQFAVGVALVVAGVLVVKWLSVIPAGLIFGGLLSLIMSGSQGGGDFFSEILDFVIGPSASSSDYDIARFVVFLAGTAALLWVAYAQFEEPRPSLAGSASAGPPAPRDASQAGQLQVREEQLWRGSPVQPHARQWADKA